MPELSLRNLPSMYRRHEPLIKFLLTNPKECGVMVQLIGLKKTSYDSTLRQLIPLLINHQGAGLIPPSDALILGEYYRTNRMRRNPSLDSSNTALLCPQRYSRLVTFFYSSERGYEARIKDEQIPEHVVEYTPIRSNEVPIKGSPSQTTDLDLPNEIPYSPKIFLALLEVKEHGLYHGPIHLLNHPPVHELPPHSDYKNVLVMEDDGRLLLL